MKRKVVESATQAHGVEAGIVPIDRGNFDLVAEREISRWLDRQVLSTFTAKEFLMDEQWLDPDSAKIQWQKERKAIAGSLFLLVRDVTSEDDGTIALRIDTLVDKILDSKRLQDQFFGSIPYCGILDDPKAVRRELVLRAFRQNQETRAKRGAALPEALDTPLFNAAHAESSGDETK